MMITGILVSEVKSQLIYMVRPVAGEIIMGKDQNKLTKPNLGSRENLNYLIFRYVMRWTLACKTDEV